jgi:alpha-glucosidase
MVQLSLSLLLAASSTALAFSDSIFPRAVDPLASCPGYKASNVKTLATGLTADLTLAGAACNVYGTDLKELTLTVTYEECMSPV